MRAYPRERFSAEVVLTPDTVGAYAQAAGDDNPVHHDPQFAACTRYGRLIASGTHTTALLLGLTATHFSKNSAMVGLEFWVRFRRPVYADETIRLEWLVVKVTPNDKLNGDVVELRGRIKGQDGETAQTINDLVCTIEKLDALVPEGSRNDGLQQGVLRAKKFKVLEAITDIDLADPALMAQAGLPVSSDDSGGYRDFSAATIQRRHDAGHKLADLKLRKLFEERGLLPAVH